MEGMGRKIFSLAECYTLLAVTAISLLAYALVSGQAHAPEQVTSLLGWTQDHHFQPSQLFINAESAFSALRARMHNTWFFFVVFTAVWAAILLWLAVEKWRNRLKDGTRELVWMGWISLAIFSLALLYGVGTNGVLARQLPYSVMITDVLAIGFVLVLPVFVWSKLHREEEEEMDTVPRRPSLSYQSAHGVLGLSGVESSTRLIEAEPVKEPQPVQVPPVVPVQENLAILKDEEKRSILTTAGNTLNSGVSLERNSVTTVDAPKAEISRTVSSFREHMHELNTGWSNIENIGIEIEKWFDQQRHQAILHLETHPGMRPSGQPIPPSRDFLNEKLAAVDAEWATIRKAALEICQWFGDAPKIDRQK